MSKTRCGGPVWFKPPGGGFGGDGLDDFGGYFKTPHELSSGPAPPDYPEPLFEEDYRNGPTSGVVFPTTASWYTDRSLPAPDHIYDFEALSGTEADHIGSVHLTPQNSPLQGKIAWGIPNGSGNWGWKRCVEFQAGSNAHLIAANSGQLDMLDSMVFMIVVRACHRNVAGLGQTYGSIFSKYDASVPRGYGFMAGGFGANRYLYGCNAEPGHSGAIPFTHGTRWQQWTCCTLAFNKPALEYYWSSPQGSGTGAINPGFVFDNTYTFRVGAGKLYSMGAVETSALCQIAYLAIWDTAANAEALGNTIALNDTFWDDQHRDPGGYYEPAGYYPDVVTQNAQGHAGVIVNTSGQSARLHDCDKAQTPYHYRPGFSHAAKLGVLCLNPESLMCWTHTDDLNNAAWVKTNAAITYANADLDEGPTGMIVAMKMAATANGGQIHHAATTGANWTYCGFFYKRHSTMGSDVTGHFRLKNLTTALYEFDQTFTARSYWQWMEVESQPANSGCQIEIAIDTNGEALALSRIYGSRHKANMVFNGDTTSVVNAVYVLGTMPAVEDWIKAAQGEIEITYVHVRHLCGVASERFVFDSDDVSGTDDLDSRSFSERTQKPTFGIWTGAGVFDHRVEGPLTTDWYGDEHTVIMQWNYNTAQFDGRYSRLFFDGVEYPGAVNPWAISGAVLKRLWIGQANEALRTFCGDAVIARVRIWEFPWQNL